MARLTLDLPADVSMALRKLASDEKASREDAAVALLRETLTALGYIEALIDEETETEGNA